MIVTVAMVQILCDWVAKATIFNKDVYKRAVDNLQRCKSRLKAEEAVEATAKAKDKKLTDKQSKKLERAKQDHNEAVAWIARKHLWPNLCTSAMFLVLMRIFAAEYKGNVIGLVPFVPYAWLRKTLFARGLHFSTTDVFEPLSDDSPLQSTDQAVSFVFIYFLCGLSIKFYASQFMGTPQPAGASESMMSVLETPHGQRVVRSFGLDPKDLKVD